MCLQCFQVGLHLFIKLCVLGIEFLWSDSIANQFRLDSVQFDSSASIQNQSDYRTHTPFYIYTPIIFHSSVQNEL